MDVFDYGMEVRLRDLLSLALACNGFWEMSEGCLRDVDPPIYTHWTYLVSGRSTADIITAKNLIHSNLTTADPLWLGRS